MEQILLPTRPFEYIAFVTLKMNTLEGMAYLMSMVDAKTGYAFHLGLSPQLNDTVLLEKVYELTEHPEFVKLINGQPFTLVFEDFEHLFEPIRGILKFHQGDIILNRHYNHHISNDFVNDLQNRLGSMEYNEEEDLDDDL